VEQVELLKRIPLFRNLDDTDLGLIATKLHRERYSKGVYVFNKGDFGDTLYLVDSGELAVVGDDGDQAIAFLGPGSFVGEISLLLTQPRTATLQVVIDAQLWALRKADFEELIRTRPAIALEMMREISRRLVKTTEQKAVTRKRRRITAVFGGMAQELARYIFVQVKSPVGFLPLSGAEIPADVTISGGLMMLGRKNLDEVKLAESLSYQVGVFSHIVIALPDEPDPVTRKAIGLADTVKGVRRTGDAAEIARAAWRGTS